MNKIYHTNVREKERIMKERRKARLTTAFGIRQRREE